MEKINGIFRTESVSFPRSGHAIVTDILKRYYGDRLSYSGDWPGPGEWREGINFQKNHDFGLVTPILSDRKYLVQFRHPLDSALSWFNMTAKFGDTPNSHYSRVEFVRPRLFEWANFIEKWVLSDIPNRLVVRYAHLLKYPRKVISNIVYFMSEEKVDNEKIEKILKEFLIGEKTSHFVEEWENVS